MICLYWGKQIVLKILETDMLSIFELKSIILTTQQNFIMIKSGQIEMIPMFIDNDILEMV